jgi:hypothetical protein
MRWLHRVKQEKKARRMRPCGLRAAIGVLDYADCEYPVYLSPPDVLLQ